MKSLKQRPDLPARVRSLLEGVLERSANQFEHAISRTLDELEQELFKLAERSRSNEQQQARFEGLREIKRGRADIAGTTLAGYAILNLRASWSIGTDWRLTGRIENLFDRDYALVRGYNTPGRAGFVEVVWQPAAR